MKLNGKDYGWKSIAGALCLGLGVVSDVLGFDPSIGQVLQGIGASVGVVGLRSAVAKIGH